MISKSDIKRGFLLLSSMFHAKHVSFNAFFIVVKISFARLCFYSTMYFPFLLNSRRWLFVQK